MNYIIGLTIITLPFSSPKVPPSPLAHMSVKKRKEVVILTSYLSYCVQVLVSEFNHAASMTVLVVISLKRATTKQNDLEMKWIHWTRKSTFISDDKQLQWCWGPHLVCNDTLFWYKWYTFIMSPTGIFTENLLQPLLIHYNDYNESLISYSGSPHCWYHFVVF